MSLEHCDNNLEFVIDIMDILSENYDQSFINKFQSDLRHFEGMMQCFILLFS